MFPSPVVPIELESAVIIEDARSLAPENLKPFLADRRRTCGNVGNCPDGTVVERRVHHNVVARLQWERRLIDRRGRDDSDSRCRQVDKRIEEVTRLADDSAAAFFQVVDPRRRWNISRAEAVIDEKVPVSHERT